MIYRLKIILFSVAVFTSPLQPVFAIDWERVINKNDIQVYVRDFPNSEIKQFRGEVSLSSSIDSVVALLSDQTSCINWLHQCESGLEIERLTFGERYIYQVNGVHLFADTRDYIIHTKMYREPDSGVITIELQTAPDYCKDSIIIICTKINQSNYIRVTRLTGSYKLIPLEEKGVKVLWTQHIEPNGILPDFIVNSLLKKIPFESLKSMREIVLVNPYNTASLKFDDIGQVAGLQ